MTALGLDLPGLVVRFNVLGSAAPKGSGRAILIRGRAMMIPSGSNTNRDALKSWDANVRQAAAEAIGERESPPFVDTALDVTITFYVARPASHWSSKGGLKDSAPRYPTTKPDIDKLARSTLDSLIGIVFDDDSRIARLTLEKLFAAPGKEGATIAIGERAGR